jgi:hypothetical protein
LIDLGAGLLAEARRRVVTAVSADDCAGYGIVVTRSGTESAAKEFAAFESAGDLLEFLITQYAGAHSAKHTVGFHGMLLFDFLAADYKRARKAAMNENLSGAESRSRIGKRIGPIAGIAALPKL